MAQDNGSPDSIRLIKAAESIAASLERLVERVKAMHETMDEQDRQMNMLLKGIADKMPPAKRQLCDNCLQSVPDLTQNQYNGQRLCRECVKEIGI